MSYPLLLCNGACIDSAMIRKIAEGADYILCADGGAETARSVGIQPDAIIGDLDSVKKETAQFYHELGVALIHDSSQEETDFEKALLFLSEKSYERIVILGMTGGLLDHTLGNFSILLRHLNRWKPTIFDPNYRIDIIRENTLFRSRPGDRISVAPFLEAKGVTYTNLKYPLRDADLTFGKREGTSNISESDVYHIALRDGFLLVFRPISAEILNVFNGEKL